MEAREREWGEEGGFFAGRNDDRGVREAGGDARGELGGGDADADGQRGFFGGGDQVAGEREIRRICDW
jgi:hypothetical protein